MVVFDLADLGVDLENHVEPLTSLYRCMSIVETHAQTCLLHKKTDIIIKPVINVIKRQYIPQ